MNSIQIADTVKSIEKSHKELIENFFLTVYPSNHLVSHGISHHRRVWENAKELILNSGIPPENIDNKFILNTITASYFHDIGMAEDPGTKHGALGRKICTEFLMRNNMLVNEFRVALEAIEYHDDKEYLTHPEDNKVLDILSLADDLDAFGITGIYRYTEIYLKRGIALRDIGTMIINNARSRFENLEKRQGLSGEFLLRQRVRYNYLINFFMEYNKQLNSYSFSSAYPSGYCGIIQILAKSDAPGYQKNIEISTKDQFITNFFNQLKVENELIRTS